MSAAPKRMRKVREYQPIISPKIRDITGQRFGRLTAIKCLGSHKGAAYYLCACECGGSKEARVGHLLAGRTQSCGCFRKETTSVRLRTHGKSGYGGKFPSEYGTWLSMKGRCRRVTSPDYPRYGARGVTVCGRWLHGEGGKGGFECFLEDMGHKPTLKHTIDRYPDQKGPYAPWNCRWATPMEQNQNRKTTVWVTINGATRTIQEWADKSGLSYRALYKRVRKGWSSDNLLLPPLSNQYHHRKKPL